jgi:hypothetical protein
MAMETVSEEGDLDRCALRDTIFKDLDFVRAEIGNQHAFLRLELKLE